MPRKKPNRCADCLTVLCPTTLTAIPTTTATDVRMYGRPGNQQSRSHVLTAGGHTYSVFEAFVEATISYVRVRGDVAQLELSAAVLSRFRPILHAFGRVFSSRHSVPKSLSS
jgi:hypothetical protein